MDALADLIDRHAQALERGRRSPLYVRLMRGAADDARRGGVPELRLMAALHHLVLAGDAPELAAYYPNVGGQKPPDEAWPAAEATLRGHLQWVRHPAPKPCRRV